MSIESKLKHLDFIQGVVNRHSTNSFLLKGWSVVLVSALIAVGTENREGLVYVALLPAIVFWGLDGYFLWQERTYRRLYDSVRAKAPEQIDFCMDTRPVSKDVKGWRDAIFSPSLFAFHGILLIAIACAMLYPIKMNWGQ